MNYKKILEKLGLIEDVDFILVGSSFEMKAKIHQVEISPAVLDENGVVITEAVMEDQSYFPDAPSEQLLKYTEEEIALDEADVAILVSEYLLDKSELRDVENDSLNIVNNRIYEWHFKNIPQPSREQLLALIPLIKPHIADISPRQIRLALLSLGITEETVDTAIDTLEAPIKEQVMIAWKFSTNFVRRVPIISAIGVALGLDEAQLDTLWSVGAGM